MKLSDALLRMRSYAPNGPHPDWADRIEEEINTLSAANDWSKGEIERLRREADDQRLAADQMRKAWRDRGDVIDLLQRKLMRLHNFPSHPGGHKDDRSDEAMVPEDWRHGWICAVAAMQESVMEAQQADHTQSDTVSDRVRSDHSEQNLEMVADQVRSGTIRNDIETLRRFARVHPDPATMEWFAQCATRYASLDEELTEAYLENERLVGDWCELREALEDACLTFSQYGEQPPQKWLTALAKEATS
jgi:hypothetical protein